MPTSVKKIKETAPDAPAVKEKVKTPDPPFNPDTDGQKK
jgi:hypothetical protein